MKNFLSNGLKVLAVTALFGVLSAGAFEEGVDYIKLEKPLSVQKGTLTKIFSYACPFCYKYDKAVTPKVVAKVDGLKYIPYHLKTKGEFGESASNVFAVLVAIDNANGVDVLDENSKFKKAKFEIYKAYHDKKERWGNGKDKESFIKTALDAAGVSMSEYKMRLDSAEVAQILKNWDESYEVAKIQGVPAFVVDGKYLIYTQNIKSIDAMAELIEEIQSK